MKKANFKRPESKNTKQRNFMKLLIPKVNDVTKKPPLDLQ